MKPHHLLNWRAHMETVEQKIIKLSESAQKRDREYTQQADAKDGKGKKTNGQG